MNCDRIARVYRWLEYLAFGRELERRRFHFLSDVTGARRALMLGDGDGRFLAKFAASSPASIDYIDASAGMLQLARARAPRANFCQGDALMVPLAPAAYDLVVTHFFLDCFRDTELEGLAKRITDASQPGARWLISEFRQPSWATPILSAMYLFFRIVTGLQTNYLVDHRPILRRHGFRLIREATSRAGLLASELWVKSQ